VQSPGIPFTACLGQASRLPCGNAAVSIAWNPVWNLFLAAVRYHGYYASPDGQTWTRIGAQPGVNLTIAMCPYLTSYSGSTACPIYNGALAVQPLTGDSFALTTDINNQDQGIWRLSCTIDPGSTACDPANIDVTQIGDAALDCGPSSAPSCPAGNSQPSVIPQADYDLYLAAVPAIVNSQSDTLLFAGTADIYRCDLNAGCAWRNTTHAQSFDCNSAHVAPAQYAIDATFGGNGLIYFGNDGGVWRTTDAIAQTQPQCSPDDATHFQNLNPGFSGSLEVRFAPALVGSNAGLVTLYANLPSGQLTVPLSGTGTPGAAVTLTPSTLCFAPALIGQTSSTSCQGGAPTQPGQPPIQPGQSIVIANTGGATVSLSSVSISGDFAIATNTCGKSLAAANTANDSCTVNITFTPTVSGSRSGALTIVDSAGTQTAQLLGTGQTAATDVLMPASLTFASQPVGSVSAAQHVTLTNTGDQPLQSISVQASTAFSAANNCGTTLGGHSSCAILVSFLPATIGGQSGVLTVSDTIAEGATAKVDSQQVLLAGTGTAPVGVASATPFSLDFGYYAVNQTSPVQNVTITNNGTANLSNIQTAVNGDFAVRAVSESPCGETLATGASCNIGVVFSPSQISQRAGSLTITAIGLPEPLVVALSGTGSSFTMKVTGSSSQVITGSQAAQPFQLEIDPVGGSTGPVAFTCAVVPATATCTVSPASVTLTGNSSQNATVTFTATQAAVIDTRWKNAAFALALLLPIGFLGVSRRKWSALIACVFLLLLFPIGCGVNSSGGGTGTGASQSSPVGEYNITVSASMPGLTQTASMQVTLQ
jgi:hypothetical protein